MGKREKTIPPTKDESLNAEEKDHVKKSKKKSNKLKRQQVKTIKIIAVICIIFCVPISYVAYGEITDPPTLDPENLSSTIGFNFTLGPYVYDHEKALSDRLEAMKKYNYPYSLHSIDRRNNLSLEEFHDVYDAKWPVLITDCVPKWPAFKKWNTKFFKKHYGEDQVSMAVVDGSLSSRQMVIISLSRFLDHINQSAFRLYTYLQDELFIPKRPELHQDIGTCNVLQEDFFPLFQEVVRPWWAFILWGTRFSRSMNHVDPYNWTGTNAVLIGLKRWKLYPPGQDHLISDRMISKNPFPLSSPSYISSVDAYDMNSLNRYPKVKQAKVVEFVQQPGELLIIPTGWYHQAFNEEPTLAISGQLMNTKNFRIVVEEMLKANNIPRTGFPNNMDKLSPKEQVEEFVKRLPRDILDKGKTNTEFVMKQLRDHERMHREQLEKYGSNGNKRRNEL